MFINALFLPFPLQGLMIAIMIVIPLLPILYVFNETFWGNNKILEVITPSTTRKRFLQVQPYICEECVIFTTKFREIYENYGAKNSLRSSNKKDYKNYILKKNS